MSIKSFYVLVLTFSLANNAQAACFNATLRTTPNQVFTIHNNGTVTHNTTGLMWMRCLLGQVWDGSTCHGTGQGYTWQSALQAANGYSFAGYNDWRMPNMKELASIVERACRDPAINTSVFPNTPAWVVWSSTPGNWLRKVVKFDSGGLGWSGEPSGVRVRLVRDAQ